MSDRTGNAVPDLPLTGITVLDLTQVYAGPTCTRILADLGAEVIKVEGLRRFDVVRNLLVADNNNADDYWNHAAYFHFRNGGKKSLTLDFNGEEGLDLFKRLVEHADVVAESFSPHVMEKWALDYQSLSKIRADIIMISLSGYGQTGPWRDYVAYGMGLEPASGISSITGYRDGPPIRSGISFTDPYSGVVGAGAVLSALAYRRRTGRGQYIDLSEHEAAIPVTGYALMDYVMNGRVARRDGNRSPWFAPQGCYPCAGEDNWLALTVRDDAEWAAFCGVAGHPEWADDPRFADVPGRFRHHDELDAVIATWSRRQDKTEAMHRLQAAGVTAAAVLSPKEALFDPHLRARGFYDRVEEPDVGPRPVPKQTGARFSAFETQSARPAPELGQHNREVLQGILGLSDGDLARLEAQGAIGETPVIMPSVEIMRMFVQWPVTTFQQMGWVSAVEPDYKEQLGL